MTKTCRVFPKSLQIGFSAAFYPLKNGLLPAKWEVNCHWHKTPLNQPLWARRRCLQNCVCSANTSTNTKTNTCRFSQPTTSGNVVFKRSICLYSVLHINTSIVEEGEKFCVISSRSFNLSTPDSHLNKEFPTLIIPTQPKSGQLLQNQVANRFNLNFVKTIDLGKGNCGLLPIHPMIWSFF